MLNAPGMAGIALPRSQHKPRYRRNTRQSFTAKPETAHLIKIIKRFDLACCMTAQSQSKIIFMNTNAVVAHQDALDAALLYFQLDTARTGVKTVFQQFFNH